LGHVRVVPAVDRAFLSDCSVEELHELGALANGLSSALFELLNSEGTNIIVTEHPVRYDVLARFQDDGLDLKWKPSKVEKSEMDSVASRISEKIIAPDEPKKQAPVAREPSVEPPVSKPAQVVEARTQPKPIEKPVEKPKVRFVRRIP
jgi:hypothetical protein